MEKLVVVIALGVFLALGLSKMSERLPRQSGDLLVIVIAVIMFGSMLLDLLFN